MPPRETEKTKPPSRSPGSPEKPHPSRNPHLFDVPPFPLRPRPCPTTSHVARPGAAAHSSWRFARLARAGLCGRHGRQGSKRWPVGPARAPMRGCRGPWSGLSPQACSTSFLLGYRFFGFKRLTWGFVPRDWTIIENFRHGEFNERETSSHPELRQSYPQAVPGLPSVGLFARGYPSSMRHGPGRGAEGEGEEA